MKKFISVSMVLLLSILFVTGCDNEEDTTEVVSRRPDSEVDSEVTDLQLALLNNVVYQEGLYDLEGKSIEDHGELIDRKFKDHMSGGDELVEQLKGYKLVDFDHGDPTGFRAAAFTKGNSLVIVYCGTEDFKDMLEDAKAGLFDVSVQDDQAKAFAKDNIKKYKNYDLYISGYSMGGRLCYLGTEEAYDNLLAGNLKKVRTFNGLGVKEFIDFGDGNLSNLHNLEVKFADKAYNYIVEGDFVSDENAEFSFKRIGYAHIGEEFKVPCTNKVDVWPLKQHDLYSIIDYMLNGSQKGKTTQKTTKSEAKSGINAEDYIVGSWEAGNDSGIEFGEDGVFYFDWSYNFGYTEEGTYSIGKWTSDKSFIIDLDGTSLITLMKLVYGAMDNSYHFEVLISDENTAYLVQVTGDKTAETSNCKLPLKRIE